MKVLFQLMPKKELRVGGGSVRMREIAAQLRKNGVTVTVTDAAEPPLRGVDLIHFWDFDEVTTYKQAARARKAGVPYVVSPIAINTDFYGMLHKANPAWRLLARVTGARIALMAFSRWTDQRVKSNSAWRRTHELLGGAALLVPTSLKEARYIRRRFRTGAPIRVTPNGIPTVYFAKARPERFKKKHGLDTFVLNAARTEVLKNQDGLVRAMAGTGLTLVVAGPITGYGKDYWQDCVDEAKRLGVPLKHVGNLSTEELRDAYAAASAHVLCSWYETTGQVSLQAAATGCPIVQTAQSPHEEYFELAEICRPESVRSIREAILRAVAMPASRRRALRSRMKRYTWESAAKATQDAYRFVLKR
ncbi:MAG TPA: glycosyltransferase family 4 protein [Patescibacteria group bacterium]|jgi:glycosyltransferase involved in cell wall biosynthesis